MKEVLPLKTVCDRILDNIASKTPLSLIRYGDGEAMILNGLKDEEKLDYVLTRQLGYLPSPWDKANIRSNLIMAYKDCDIIGVPIENRFMEDPESFLARAANILSQAVGDREIESKDVTSIDIHSHMLENDFFDELLFRKPRLYYISCRNLDDQLKEKYRIQEVHSFIIAPEAKFTSGYCGDPHYPYQFDQIREWIATLPIEGTVCLVGAGVVGKIYNNWFRDLGGISIDIGSVFDSWAGKVTRGPGRSIDAEDSTYKL
jgi:hypothetical protein